MKAKEILGGKRQGIIQIPPSKSDGQRALLASSLAKGVSFIKNLGNSEDEQNMLRIIQELGAEVSDNSEGLQIRGIESFPIGAKIKIGESGLGMRLLSSICASHTGSFLLETEGSLSQRPVSWFETHFPIFGATFLRVNETTFRVTGTLQGKTEEIDGSQGSQYVSGLLMALPLAKKESRLQVASLKSKPYIDMTLRTLEAFGIEVLHNEYDEFIIAGNQRYLPTKYVVESDWSSASFWLVASALGHEILCANLSMASYQADRLIINAFHAANCNIHHTGDGIRIDGSNKNAFFFDATHCPDLFPPLTILALGCKGISTIRGVHRLANKESNRAEVLMSELQKAGAKLFIENDDLIIHGCEKLVDVTLNPHEDHRMAMAFAIAAISFANKIEIENPECVSKSYPQFWEHLKSLQKHSSLL